MTLLDVWENFFVVVCAKSRQFSFVGFNLYLESNTSAPLISVILWKHWTFVNLDSVKERKTWRDTLGFYLKNIFSLFICSFFVL